ncbi:hypothetical protein ACQCN2_05465 [Brevibacillus ginsengisoli]|uniref:hypothetical protein n=1 Tax=Brevibacillus ginsengisoli TaxID=363854 RepID=UPI003CF48983
MTCKKTEAIRFLDIKETIHTIEQDAYRSGSIGGKESSGAFNNGCLAIEWVVANNSGESWAKVVWLHGHEHEQRNVKEIIQHVTEAVCQIAIQAWHETYGRKTDVIGVEQIECYMASLDDKTYYLRLQPLSATSTAYRADVSLFDRHGRRLIQWNDIRGLRQMKARAGEEGKPE